MSILPHSDHSYIDQAWNTFFVTQSLKEDINSYKQALEKAKQIVADFKKRIQSKDEAIIEIERQRNKEVRDRRAYQRVLKAISNQYGLDENKIQKMFIEKQKEIENEIKKEKWSRFGFNPQYPKP